MVVFKPMSSWSKDIFVIWTICFIFPFDLFYIRDLNYHCPFLFKLSFFHWFRYSLNSLTVPTNIIVFIKLPPSANICSAFSIHEHLFYVKVILYFFIGICKTNFPPALSIRTISVFTFLYIN